MHKEQTHHLYLEICWLKAKASFPWAQDDINAEVVHDSTNNSTD